MPCSTNNNRGVSVVEALVASAIILLVVSSTVTVYTFYLNHHQISVKQVQANLLLEEGMEALRSLRDQSWDNTLAAWPLNTPRYLNFNQTAGQWEATTTPEWVNGQFKRQFTIEEAYRDSDNDLADSGSADNDFRLVTVQVSWPNGDSSTTTKQISGYLGNLFTD